MPDFADAWLVQRMKGSSALAEVSKRELRDLSDAEALRRTDALLSLGARQPVSAARETHSGFVEQQALFARMRR
jgi:hypothetical protein